MPRRGPTPLQPCRLVAHAVNTAVVSATSPPLCMLTPSCRSTHPLSLPLFLNNSVAAHQARASLPCFFPASTQRTRRAPPAPTRSTCPESSPRRSPLHSPASSLPDPSRRPVLAAPPVDQHSAARRPAQRHRLADRARTARAELAQSRAVQHDHATACQAASARSPHQCCTTPAT